MSGEPWTWDERAHPRVAGAFTASTSGLEWRDRLEWWDRLDTAPEDAIVGKVLCVCAASAIARAVIAVGDGMPRASDALELLDAWIDDPTEDRFEQICSLLFGDGEPPDLSPHGVVRWALRTATSSVGNYEAGWALSGTCEAAELSGFSSEDLCKIAERAVLARRK